MNVSMYERKREKERRGKSAYERESERKEEKEEMSAQSNNKI